MGWVLCDTQNKRIKDTEGRLTPYFKYLEGAMQYWKKYLGASQAVKFHRTDK
jgi:hypothetical protein